MRLRWRVIYAALSWFVFRRGANRVLGDAYALLAAGFATLAVPLALSARATAGVFALEGAALAWLGVRQQRLVPQLAGFVLHIIAAGACLYAFNQDHGVAGPAIANGQFMGLLIVAIGALATAWVYRRDEQLPQFALYYVWGLLWWLGAITREVIEFAPNDSRARPVARRVRGHGLARGRSPSSSPDDACSSPRHCLRSRPRCRSHCCR